MPRRGQTRVQSATPDFATARAFKLTVPTNIARIVGPDRVFEVELTDDGILYRYVEGDGPTVAAPPAWLAEAS